MPTSSRRKELLFSGAHAAAATKAMAKQLRRDLYRADLSAVVSKSIGETEEKLKRVFTRAEASGAILMFDEADALFGKRSEVKDSHDRYSNIEIGYLLQQIKQHGAGRFDGVIVTALGAHKLSGRAGKRPRDHTSHPVRPVEHLARNFANAVKLLERYHVLMRGNLEN